MSTVTEQNTLTFTLGGKSLVETARNVLGLSNNNYVARVCEDGHLLWAGNTSDASSTDGTYYDITKNGDQVTLTRHE